MITTIWQLLNNRIENLDISRGINIPMIQRDYAQGREDKKVSEIREVFTTNILNAICDVIKDNKEPLELDFIYGYIESKTFIPLDGQQRLTTLFLLYWYLAFKDEELIKYKDIFAKFNYQTRKSSENFLKQLINNISEEDHTKIFEKEMSFDNLIHNKNWFYLDWDNDLTIKSMIVRLDTIHNKFKGQDIKFQDLIREEKPCLVFNFLDIENFGLSDDLYIKMNSRGKPLTDFENLKAELGRFIKESDFNNNYDYKLSHIEGEDKAVDVSTYFSSKIDTAWTDYFWGRRDEKDKFDDKLLNLLVYISLLKVIKNDNALFDKVRNNLDQDNILSYHQFKNLELLNENSIIAYIDILDLLVSEDDVVKSCLESKDYLDVPSIIEQAFEADFKANYQERILFYAVFEFLLNKKRGDRFKEEFLRWSRLMHNLVYNTIYNSSKDFKASIDSIDSILNNYRGDIYKQIVSADIKGFDSQQILEEKLKIELFDSSQEWNDLILDAERHPYLNGQIVSLLSYSGVFIDYKNKQEIKASDFYSKVNNYLSIFKLIFNGNGLIDFEDEIFRRALLVKGDYLLYRTNWSFIMNGNDRDISWKRLLKNAGVGKEEDPGKRSFHLKTLIDDILMNNNEDQINEASIKSSLKKIIDEHKIEDWRTDFINNPVLFKINDTRKRYQVKFRDNRDNRGNIYLLRGEKYMKESDPELKVLLIKETLKGKGYDEDSIKFEYITAFKEAEISQYGIVEINGSKPKIFYNHDFAGNYTIMQKGKENFITKDFDEVIKYITDNFWL